MLTKHQLSMLYKALPLSIISVSTILLGIWATSGTIALRNILLCIGFILGCLYWYNWINFYVLNSRKNNQLALTDVLPFICIGLTLCWIIFHYLYLSTFQEQQLNEIKSTWLRTCLGITLGSAAGLVIKQNTFRMCMVWLGIFVSFVILMLQYIPKAILNKSIFAVDWYGNYIYFAKFNGVLMGSILIAALIGLYIDQNKLLLYTDKFNNNKEKWKIRIINMYIFSGITIAAYSFVFVFDSKNGIGILILLIIFWIIYGNIFWIINYSRIRKNSKTKINYKQILLGIILMFTLLIVTVKHFTHNPGWLNLIEDIIISTDIEKNQQWKNLIDNNPPKRSNDQYVANNTYERVSLTIVGIKIIADNPLGVGVNRSFHHGVAEIEKNFKGANYTHSGWIDLCISYGIPFIFLTILSIVIILIKNISRAENDFKGTLISISVCILILYTVGEYSFQHSIEILFFLIAFMTTLTWKISNNQKKKLIKYV